MKTNTSNRCVTALFLVACSITLSSCTEPKARMCPTGVYCPASGKCAAKQAICISDNCGNSVIDRGEVCDDGNIIDGDGCSANCKSNETCGNGIIDTAIGEVCDDGPNQGHGFCADGCRATHGCGNGVLDPGEQCDPSSKDTPKIPYETATCNYDCTLSVHGDGKVDQAAGEDCDRDGLPGYGLPGHDGSPGPSCESATCTVYCKVNRCGDHYTNRAANEQCDNGDGNNSDDADCTADCQNAFCGDLHINKTLVNGKPKEACDNGKDNVPPGSPCAYDTINPTRVNTCTACSSADCSNITLSGPYCGDGTKNGPEACDNGAGDGFQKAANGATDCPRYGLSCSGCSADCRSVTTPSAHFCGDGITDYANNEPCDNGTVTCGVCSPECKTRGLASEQGSITVQSTDINDGDSFAFGSDATFTFGKSKDYCVAGDNYCISIYSQSTPLTTVQIANAIYVKISDTTVESTLNIVPAHKSLTSVVILTNDSQGMFGNHTITTKTKSAGGAMTALKVTGMSGGVGCLKNDKCVTPDDCVLGLDCKGTPSTCQ